MVRGYSDGHIDGVRDGRHRGFEQGHHAGVQEERADGEQDGRAIKRQRALQEFGRFAKASGLDQLAYPFVCLLSIEYQQKEELSCVK